MPRKPRFFIPGMPVHVVQRGRNREPVFYDDADYRLYLGLLQDALKKFGCLLHAYVLMTNHVHLLITPDSKTGISKLMQAINRHYVPYINFVYGSSGTIWEGRFKASLVDADNYLLACMRYIELNPVRAAMVQSPRQYQWSSYRFNAFGQPVSWLSCHEAYCRLGDDENARQSAYRALFDAHVDKTELSDIFRCYKTGTPLGNDYFKARVEQKLKCRVGYDRRGRPGKGV